MEKLSTELLQQIFELLPLEDHFQCIRTCHLWNSIIEEVYLFQTMTIYSERLNPFLKKTTECKRRLGKRIDQVQLYQIYCYDETNIANYLRQFPNIRKITSFTYCARKLPLKEAISWHRSIESIFEFGDIGLIHHLLSTSICPNLTELTTKLEQLHFIPLLKNAPNLKVFVLIQSILNFEKINLIHENTPNLKSLTLRKVLIQGEPFDNRIIPVHSVTEFIWKFHYYLNPERRLNFLQFIIVKYPNLVEFRHYDMFDIEDTEEDRNNLFEFGYNPLISSLAPRLKKLHLNNTGPYQKFLDAFDIHKCQIQDLTLHDLDMNTFPTFEHSKQVQYIRSLSLIEVRITSFKWLKELNVLESLDIQTNKGEKELSIDFNQIIENASPTLASLKLFNIALRSKLNSSRQTNIETLSLAYCKLPHEIGMFIDRHFPLLSNLEFRHCRYTSKKFILRSIGLNSFLIVDGCNKKAINILVHTTLDNNDRWYSTREEVFYKPFHAFAADFHNKDYPPVKSQPAEDLTVKPDFVLTCYKVNETMLCR